MYPSELVKSIQYVSYFVLLCDNLIIRNTSTMDTSFLWYALSSGSMILLSFLLLTNVTQINKLANRWLGIFFLCLFMLFTQLFIEAIPLECKSWCWLIPLLELPRWATFPCFFLALMYFVNPIAPSKTIFLHFIPFFLFFLYALLVLFPSAYSNAQIPFSLPQWVVWIIRYLFFGQAILYGALSFLLLRRHKRQIERFSANTEGVNLAWIRLIMYAVLGMTALWILGKNYPLIAAFVPFGYFAITLFIAYHALHQRVIYPVSEAQLPEVIEAIAVSDKRYARLTEDQVKILQENVHQAVVREKFYLDPLLNLPLLSEKVGIGTHELSFVLNQGFGKNFYQYINELRIEEAKWLLKTPEFQNKDIASVAIYAGFNSKTTFYTAFKKITGITPKTYLAQTNI